MIDISLQEYLDWKKDKCTKALLSSIDSNIKMMTNNWSNKAYRKDTIDATVMNESEILGQIQGLKQLALAIMENRSIPLKQENEDA